MKKMNAIVFESSGHLLGVVTREAQSDKTLTVEDAAPNGVLIRDGDDATAHNLIDASQLQVKEVEYDTRAVYRPHRFAEDSGRVAEQNEPPVLQAATIDGTTLTVNLVNPVVGDTDTWVYITGCTLSEPISRTVTILDTESSATVNQTLGGGSYHVTLFVRGFRTLIQPQVDL
ncbi:MAG: hypothetical protein ACR2RL_25225 [Gammaproteobacteria bacterium]